MELKDVMNKKNFVVVGNTLKEGKYAYRIRNGLSKCGYNVSGVHNELGSINDVEGDIDIIDLCINPVKGLEYMKENVRKPQCVVIQPGAESEELIDYLKSENIDYLESCLLIGMRKYRGADF